MKQPNKFLIIFLVLTILFSSVSALFAFVQLQQVRETSNKAVSDIVIRIKEEYPEVSENEIAEILNSESDTDSSALKLEKYGINPDEEWVVYENESSARKMVIGCTAICALSGIVLCAVFVIYCARRKKETNQIVRYIEEINRKNYNLHIEENSEDDMSSLKNEIYKITVMLKEQAENSLKDKENLKDSLSDISHQLKTPLTSILVMLDNITDDKDMPEKVRADFLNDIRREANSISFLVQSILTLSKFDANSIVLKSRSEKISEIIDDSIKNTAVLAELKEVNVSGECAEDIKLDCDFKWLCEAVTNIVKNCVEHTDRGGTVKISAEQNKMYTKISIEDNGCGISKKDLPHIFKRFYKGGNSNDESVGIGLALAKTIVEKGGGYLFADSELGKGSKFEIRFFGGGAL